jgi:Tol biopolymer transport system component/DNA-binding winged helix-turn-helix (wHTH) protein
VWQDGKLLDLEGKPFEILVYLLLHRDRVIDKDELLRAVWPDTFVQENNLVRHISTLRKSLGQRADDHSCIVTVKGRGYQCVADVTELTSLPAALPTLTPSEEVGGANQESADESPEREATVAAGPGPAAATTIEAAPLPESHLTVVQTGVSRTAPISVPGRSKNLTWFMVAGIAASLVAASAAFVFVGSRSGPRPSSAPRLLRQVTYGPSTHVQPSWSPDGRSVTFASDQTGNFDIWVQRLDGSEPQQVTNSPGQEWQPAWSPDGQWLAYRSEERGGGLYVVSLNGGMIRRLSDFGYLPRWSPDGSRILFSSAMVSRRPRPQHFVTVVDGAQSQEIRPDLTAGASASAVAWAPDGQVAIWTLQQGKWSFVVAPLDGSNPTRFTIADELTEQVKELGLEPSSFVWSPDSRHLIFDGMAGGVRNLWRVAVDTSRRSIGPPLEPLTTGAGTDRDAVLSPDGTQIAYSSVSERTRIWSFALDATGRISGNGVPVTLGGSGEFDAAVSADGQRLIYRTTRDGRQELWEHWLQDGHERRLIAGDEGLRSSPRWSPDGTRLAYQLNVRRPRAGVVLAVFAFNDMREQMLTSPGASSLVPDDWSRDGSLILGPCVDPNASTSAACVARAITPTYVRPLVSDPKRSFRSLRFSPDQKWISAVAVSRGGNSSSSQVVVLPFEGGQPISITDGSHYDQKPVWGVDGRTVYFISNRDGFFNVWGRRFDGDTRAPIGEPFPVTTFSNPGLMIAPDLDRLEMAVAARHLYLPVTESTGQIFVLRHIDR